MSESFFQDNDSIPPSKDLEKVTLSKSSFNKIIIGVIIAISVATFFAGFVLGNSFDDSDSKYLTKTDMENAITSLENKIDKVQNINPNPQPSQGQVQPTTPSIIQVSLDDDPVKGDPDAPITIVEFSDFQCPFCSRFYDQTLSQLEEQFIDTGKVKLVYRDLPLDSIHPNARAAHIAAECADEQEKFWDYHNMLFESQADWNRLSPNDLTSKLIEYSVALNLDSETFEACLQLEEIDDEISADVSDARNYGATGTPTFFVGNEKDGFVKLVGAQPFTSFKSAIDNLS